MPASTIFARAIPKSIKVTEKYNYDATISNNAQTQMSKEKEPTGTLEIIIPYDGEKYFTQAAAKDVKRQNANAWKRPNAQVRIGYLGFANPGRSNLGNLLNLSLGYDVAPLDLAITGEPLPDRKELLKNEHACKLTQTYKPLPPLIVPLKATVSIFDEQILTPLDPRLWDSLVDGKAKDEKNLNDRLQKAATALAQQEIFNPDLTFIFEVELCLQAPVGRLNDDNPPTLMRCALAWPVALDPKQISLEMGREQQTSIYNPEPDLLQQGAIEWRNIPFKPQPKNEQLNAFIYKTPRMRLSVAEPGELYLQPRLSGKMEIKIPRALSGLDLKYFNVDGQKSTINIDYRTTLTVDFQLELADRFKGRMHAPYRHLHFEGIALTQTRIADIQNVVEDFGFDAKVHKLNNPPDGKEQYIIVGRPRQGDGDRRLWLLVESEALRTMRRREIPGDHTYSTIFDNGALTIYMRSKGYGREPQVIEQMNHIQQSLKEHFEYVSTLA